MAAQPDIRVRLSADGQADLVRALQKVRAETELLGRSGNTAFGKFGASVASSLSPINALKSALPALGLTAIVVGLVAAAKSATDMADAAGKAAQRIGTTAEAFSTLAFGARTADVETQALEQSLGILAKNVSGLKTGTSSAADSLKELGLSASDFIGLDTSQAFELISQRLFKVANGGDRARLAMDIMGKSGRLLLPLMKDVADKGLAAMGDEAELFGLKVSGKAAAASELLNDNFTRLAGVSKGAARSLIDFFTPALNEITTKMIEAAKNGGRLDAVFAGIDATAKAIFRGSDQAQAEKAVTDGEALLARTRKLIEDGQTPVPGTFGLFTIKFDEKNLDLLKSNLVKQEKVLADAKKRLAELNKPPEKKDGAGGDAEAFDAAKRVADLTKSLRLEDLKSSEATAARQRDITEGQIRNEQALLEAKQTSAAGQSAVDRASFAAIAERTALEKQSFTESIAAIDLRQRAISVAVQKEIFELAKTGESTKRQELTLAELNRQSLDARLAAWQSHYAKLQQRQAEYIAKYKAASDAIKSIDKEVADNKAQLVAANTRDALAGLTDDEKIGVLKRRGVELEATQLKAAAAGNIEDTRKLKDELLDVNKQLNELGAFRWGEDFGKSGVDTLNNLLEKQKAAQVAQKALADKGIADTLEQAKVAGDQIKDMFSQRLAGIDLKFGVDQPALTALVDSIKDQLGKEVFRVNVTPNVQGGAAPGFARGGLIPGQASMTGPDNVLAWLKSGEHVTRVAAVNYYGQDFMRAVNEMRLPKFADGGMVGGSGTVEHIGRTDITFNGKSVGRVSGSRDTIRNLNEMLREVARGTQ